MQINLTTSCQTTKAAANLLKNSYGVTRNIGETVTADEESARGATRTRKDQGIKELDGITFRGFAVDPANSNVVYAAVELSSWVWNNGQSRNIRQIRYGRWRGIQND